MSTGRVLGVIPARGGSKGIPGKNVKPIADKPLIAWTIEAALSSQHIDHLIVSTDSKQIAEVAQGFGADVPFLRPSDLAADETPGIDPILHAVGAVAGFDWVVVLQPTSPLRSSADIDGCIQLAINGGTSSAVSICEASDHPEWTFSLSADRELIKYSGGGVSNRRQELQSCYILNGAIYVANIDWMRREKSLIGPGTLGFVMPKDRSVDIDDYFDFKIAEFLLKETR
jgi:N-acylneuraminate cytidylyltransferase/CMP-N,N'-diacetyllegionaminic acid synthase